MTNIIKGRSKAEKAAVEAKIKDLANTFDSKGVKATGMPHIPIPDHLKGSSKKEDGIVGYF